MPRPSLAQIARPRAPLVLCIAALCAAALQGCPASESQDAGAPPPSLTPDAGADGGRSSGVASDDAGAAAWAPPTTLEAPTVFLTSRAADGGAANVQLRGRGPERSLDEAGAPTPISARGTLALELAEPLEDFRIRLLDGSEALVPSDDAATPVPDGGWRYELTPLRPLVDGRRYWLVLDAQHGARVRDVRGREYDDLRVELVPGPVDPAATPPGAAGSAARGQPSTKAGVTKGERTKAKAKKRRRGAGQ